MIQIETQRQVDQGKTWVTLKVEDTGVGITKSEQDRVFERFFRGSASRDLAIPGTGLGLAICQEIIVRHGGKITMWSTHKAGSTFKIWLPVSQDWRDDQLEIWPVGEKDGD